MAGGKVVLDSVKRDVRQRDRGPDNCRVRDEDHDPEESVNVLGWSESIAHRLVGMEDQSDAVQLQLAIVRECE